MSHSICKKVDWAKLPRELLFWNWVYSLADMGSEGSTNSYQQIIYDGRVCKLVLTCLLGPKSSPVHSILGTLFSPTFKAGILASNMWHSVVSRCFGLGLGKFLSSSGTGCLKKAECHIEGQNVPIPELGKNRCPISKLGR